ncbi:unnamed protein product [Ixodes pacificus]
MNAPPKYVLIFREKKFVQYASKYSTFSKYGLDNFVSQNDALSTLKKYWEIYSTLTRSVGKRRITPFVLGGGVPAAFQTPATSHSAAQVRRLEVLEGDIPPREDCLSKLQGWHPALPYTSFQFKSS